MRSEDPQPSLAVALKVFLTIPVCPPGWKGYDLYRLRDDQVTFYVGQSGCAFDRVWEHIRGGTHGYSTVGRFLLYNWPRSGNIVVELLDSGAPRFAPYGAPSANWLDDAERALIEADRPCFNILLNGAPSPLPPGYLSPDGPGPQYSNTLRGMRGLLRRILREASRAPRRSPGDTTWEAD
jgi:hypothetical protein